MIMSDVDVWLTKSSPMKRVMENRFRSLRNVAFSHSLSMKVEGGGKECVKNSPRVCCKGK